MSQGQTEQAVGTAGTSAARTIFAALWSTVVAGRECRRSSGDQRWDTALSEPRGWYSWLMTVGMLMGITSALTIVLEGFGTLMLPLCGWNVR